MNAIKERRKRIDSAHATIRNEFNTLRNTNEKIESNLVDSLMCGQYDTCNELLEQMCDNVKRADALVSEVDDILANARRWSNLMHKDIAQLQMRMSEHSK